MTLEARYRTHDGFPRGIQNEQEQMIAGFEPEKCPIRNADDIALALRWHDRSARELAGRRVRLRIFPRGANLYAVTSG